MKIAILGYGREGQAAYAYWSTADNQLTICDQDKALALPGGATGQLGPTYLEGLEQFDLIVRTPGLYPGEIVAANTPAILDKVTTNTNEFFQVCPSKNLIGVTGTKGKGTTATLITKLLRGVGKRVHLGGNIGTPPLALLQESIQPDDWVVLELSSFQLIDLKQSPHIAVCLMIAPEHLNWHASFEEYVTAKSQLFSHQAATDYAIYFATNDISKKIAANGQGTKLPYYSPPGAYVQDDTIVIDDQTICKVDELQLLGKHNWQNVCAAITAVWQISQDVEKMHAVVTSFRGLEHRLELVREINGVTYYNDSFASTPDAAAAAIEAIAGQKILILGGFDRQLPLEQLAQSVASAAQELRRVLLIGQSAQRLAETLTRAGCTNYQLSQAKSMAEIVTEAQALAKSGDAVVLSPGFASFDMFKDFEQRGEQFKAAVHDL
jgi:UDP-N-acetylmuramoylalanine--D-glutamate ligase